MAGTSPLTPSSRPSAPAVPRSPRASKTSGSSPSQIQAASSRLISVSNSKRSCAPSFLANLGRVVPREREVMSIIAMSASSLREAQATKQSILPLCGAMDCFASLAMTVPDRCSLRRLLAAAGIEPGIDALLEAREGFQALAVHEWQKLHQDHAADVARRIDPEVGVGEPGPGKAARAAAFRRL